MEFKAHLHKAFSDYLQSLPDDSEEKHSAYTELRNFVDYSQDAIVDLSKLLEEYAVDKDCERELIKPNIVISHAYLLKSNLEMINTFQHFLTQGE